MEEACNKPCPLRPNSLAQRRITPFLCAVIISMIYPNTTPEVIVMSSKKIENGRYWNAAWQLIDGCTPCSPGCDHCWSAAMENRFHGGGGRYYDLVTDGKFNGRIMTMHERLSIPLKRRTPTVYAVWNDLFHEAVPWTFQNEAYGVMLEPSNHTYLVLTKRPAIISEHLYKINIPDMPPNIWHGLTICNQPEMEAKDMDFFNIPGKKFLSFEPLLSKVIIPPWVIERDLLSCVILGGETGPGARPMHPDWAISIVQQCRVAGVLVFVKQIHVNGKISKDMSEWPEELRVRELPWLTHN